MKKSYLLTLILLVYFLRVEGQSINEYIESIPLITKHTSYMGFDYDAYQTSTYWEFPSNVINEWEEKPTVAFDFGESLNSKFYCDMVVCIGRYYISSDRILLLMRSNYGYPAFYDLVSFKKVSGVYQPISELKVHSSGEGLSTYFSFSGSNIKVYDMSEESGKGCTYSINSNGNFTLTSCTIFEGFNYQGIFNY